MAKELNKITEKAKQMEKWNEYIPKQKSQRNKNDNRKGYKMKEYLKADSWNDRSKI